MNKIFAILLLITFFTKAISQEVDSVDYKVYSTVLKANLIKNKKSFAVLHSTTRKDFDPLSFYFEELSMSFKGEWFFYFKTDTFVLNHYLLYKEFLNISFQSKKIKSKFSGISKPVLMSKSAFDDFFIDKDDNGWDDFYKQYPDVGGFVRFSDVHYSKDGKTAILYYVLNRHYLNAKGVIAILTFNGTIWELKYEGQIWAA